MVIKNFMLFLLMLSVVFCENIFYLPEDTFFVAQTTIKKLSNKYKSLSLYQITFAYDRLDSDDNWCGELGNRKFLYPIKSTTKFLNKISQKYDNDENLYIFFYDPSFDIKKHVFAKNYNPNHLFQRRRYRSNTLKRDKQLLKDGKRTSEIAKKIKKMLAKANKRFPLSNEAPLPLKTNKMTDDMLQEQVLQALSLLKEKDWFVEEGWEEERRFSKEEMIERLEHHILNKRIIELPENSQHNIWVISRKDFTAYREGKAATFYKWNRQTLEEINQQQPKPNLNLKIEITESVIVGKKFSLNIHVENPLYLSTQKCQCVLIEKSTNQKLKNLLTFFCIFKSLIKSNTSPIIFNDISVMCETI